MAHLWCRWISTVRHAATAHVPCTPHHPPTGAFFTHCWLYRSCCSPPATHRHLSTRTTPAPPPPLRHTACLPYHRLLVAWCVMSRRAGRDTPRDVLSHSRRSNEAHHVHTLITCGHALLPRTAPHCRATSPTFARTLNTVPSSKLTSYAARAYACLPLLFWFSPLQQRLNTIPVGSFAGRGYRSFGVVVDQRGATRLW